MTDINEELPETTDSDEALDFDSSESRMSFLKTQLNDLLDGINNVYGQDLMEELLKRLEKTVEDYNGEVTGLLGKLKAGKIFDDESSDEKYSEPSIKHSEPEEDTQTNESDDGEADIIARMKARNTHD